MGKRLFGWLLFDAGNSFVDAAFGGMFLSQWIVLDNGFNDNWYGAIFTVATIFVLLTSPFWGAWSDKLKVRMPFLKGMTIFLILLVGLLVIIVSSNLPIKTQVAMALIIAVGVQYFYQLSLIFYNTLLKRLANNGELGKISGLGQAFNNFGWIAAVGILVIFANGKITLFGQPGRTQVFFPALIVFIILSLPLLFWYKEKRDPEVVKNSAGIKEVYGKTIAGLKDLVKGNKNVLLFLIGFSFVSDAILTVSLYFALFLGRVYRISDSQKFIILGLMYLCMVVGCYVLGKISDLKGIKRVMIISCLMLIVVFTIIALGSAPVVLYVVAIFAGVSWGAFFVTARVLLIKISPPEQLGEYFGFFSTFQRLASIVGPFVYGITIIILKDYDILKYRAAFLVLVFLMVVGTIIMMKVKETKQTDIDPEPIFG